MTPIEFVLEKLYLGLLLREVCFPVNVVLLDAQLLEAALTFLFDTGLWCLFLHSA